MKLKNYIIALCIGTLASCTDMDIPPMNILGDKDIFGSTEGVTSYMARLYSTLPVEDFRYSHANMFFSGGANYAQPSCLTGEAVSRDTHGAEVEKANYWDAAYALIREINYFIQTLPEYESSHSAAEVESLLGEAHFLRAYTYIALAKRYGGVPIVKTVIDYPASVSIPETQLYRDSEEATWDFIAADLDEAIAHLSAQNAKGRANKYAAAALKSRAMVYAGSIAKYNEVNEVYHDARICGIPAGRAADYFKQAYAASIIVDEGGYELYKGEWAAGDKEAQYRNFVNIFLKDTKENIFVKYFAYPESVHSYDCFAQPTQTSTGGSNTEICPTLDFVEMFEGFEKDAQGHFKNFDEDGYYKLYATTMEPFENAEPRLRATVLLPGDEFKGESIEIRRGIWVGTGDKISPLLPPGTYNFYDDQPAYVDDATSLLKLAKRESQNTDANAIVLKDGTRMKRAGKSGTVQYQEIGCTVSGFLIRKYLNPEQKNTNWNQSSQNWIDIRYAEVLLNRAEAAAELVAAGVAADASGANYRDEAFRCINLIRERAGATLLASPAQATINVVRTERRKELSFENKTYWDLKRWRIIHKEQSTRTYRTLQPFFAADAMKYFMDIKYQEQSGKVYTFDTRNYYQQIPTGEITKNPNCKQNPGY